MSKPTATKYTVVILDHKGKPALTDYQLHDAIERYDVSVVSTELVEEGVDPGEGWE